MNVQFDITLTDGQKAAYRLAHLPTTKKLVLAWSRQAGKSVFAEIMLIEYLFKANSFNVYISPTFQLGRKVYREVLACLTPLKIIKSSNSSTLTIETIFGSTLQFFSTQSPTAIRGTTCTGVLILDEAAYMPRMLPNGEDIYANVIFPITKAKNPLMIVISTPRGKSGFFFDLYSKGMTENDEGIVSMKRTILEDSLVTGEQLEEIKRSIPEVSYRQEFLCEFLDDAVTFFKGYDQCFGNIKPTGRCWIGVDLAADGSDRTVCTTIYDNGHVNQKVMNGTITFMCEQVAKYIDKAEGLVSVQIEDNGVGKGMVELIRERTGRHRHLITTFTTTNSSKEEIVSDLAVAIDQRELLFDHTCTLLYQELGLFTVTVTKSGKLTYAAAANGHDDTVMSLAIAYNTMKRFKQPQSLSFVRMNNLNLI